MTILDLPPEILLKILSHLSIKDLCQVALTCKHFKDVAYSKCLWRNEEVVLLLHQYIGEDISPSLVQRGIQMMRVQISSEEHLMSALRCLPGLVNLFLEIGAVDSRHVHQLTILKPLEAGLPSLKRLCLVFVNEFLDENMIESLASSLPQLEILIWCSEWKSVFPISELGLEEITVTNRGLNILLSKLKNLEVFIFRPNLFSETVCFDCKSESLKHLHLYNSSFTTCTLETICQSFPNLLRLEFDNCEYGGSDLPGECLRFLPHLQELGIANCGNVPKNVTDLIAEQASRGLTRFRFSASLNALLGRNSYKP